MRFFFHVLNGVYSHDDIGTELPDVAAARDEAVNASAELLKSPLRPEFWAGEAWSMHVTDDKGEDVLTLHFLADQFSQLAGLGAPKAPGPDGRRERAVSVKKQRHAVKD